MVFAFPLSFFAGGRNHLYKMTPLAMPSSKDGIKVFFSDSADREMGQEKCAATPDQSLKTEPLDDDATETDKKPLSFYLSFLALNIVVFIVSLDATALAVAIPVC